MPTALDIKMRATALRLLEKFGRDMTFIVETGGTYDPTTDETSATVETEHVAKCAPPFDVYQHLVDDDNIKQTDSMTIVAASAIDFTPAPNTTLQDGSAHYTIIAVKPLESGEQTAAYMLVLRR